MVQRLSVCVQWSFPHVAVAVQRLQEQFARYEEKKQFLLVTRFGCGYSMCFTPPFCPTYDECLSHPMFERLLTMDCAILNLDRNETQSVF